MGEPIFQLRTLGRASLIAGRHRESAAVALPPKSLAVLTYLALRGTRELQRRDMVIALFWPDRPESRARNALSQVLFGLRRVLGPEVVMGHGREEIGIAKHLLFCDAASLGERYRAGKLVDALKLYEGPFLEGFHLADCLGFERWQEMERERLRRQALDAATRLAHLEEGRDNLLGASQWLHRALEISPTDEGVIRKLVELLDRAGEPIAALEVYEEFRARLWRDLDVEPEEETETLVEHLGLESKRKAARDELEARIAALQAEADSVPKPLLDSIAVLPFRDLSAQPGRDWFADGLTEALITELTKIEALRVISRQSVTRFRGSEKPLPVIGEELGVRGIVEGSVLRAGERVRITVQLLQASPERHLWAGEFDGDLRDVLALHREVARAVAREVHIALSPEDEKRLAGPARVEPAAYEAYLRGRHYLQGVDPMRAVNYFQLALEIDPEFAPAHAGVALTQWALAIFAYASSDATRLIAEKAALRALELDPSLAEAHTAFGCCQTIFAWDWESAEHAYRRGIELNPGSSEAHGYFGVHLVMMGQADRGIAELRRMVEYDPIAPNALLAVGWALHKARRHEAAIAELESVLHKHPRFGQVHPFLAASYAILGRQQEAIGIVERALALSSEDQLTLGYGAWTLAKARRPAEAAEMLARLEKIGESRYLDPYYPAVANVGMGNLESALHWLERTYAERSASALHLASDPLLDPIRGDSDFQEIHGRMRFPAKS